MNKKINRKMFKIFFILSFMLIYLSPIHSKTIPLKLNEYLKLVLKRNLSIKIIQFDRTISKERIREAYGEFDPVISSEFYKNYSKSYNLSPGYEIDFSSELSGKLYVGTYYSISFNHVRSKYDSDNYYNEITFSATQPLLKNFGKDINKSEIKKSKLKLKITDKKIEDFVNNITYEALKVYWQLYNSYYKLKAAEESLQNAKNVHKINKKKFSLGLIPESVLLESLAEVKSREEDLINYKEEFYNLNDRLKNYFNNLNSDVIYMPVTEPKILNNIISLKDAIKMALKNRYEIIRKRYEKEIQQIESEFDKNHTLPELNFNISASLIGNNDHFNDSLHKLKSGDYYNWKIGLQFKYPLGNSINKSRYEIAKANLMRINFELKNEKNKIILEVKKAIRQVKTNIKKIEATEKSLESAKEKLDIETEKFKQGLSTPFKVFHFQRDYTSAKYKFIDAKTNYIISIFYLKKVLGEKLWDTL